MGVKQVMTNVGGTAVRAVERGLAGAKRGVQANMEVAQVTRDAISAVYKNSGKNISRGELINELNTAANGTKKYTGDIIDNATNAFVPSQVTKMNFSQAKSAIAKKDYHSAIENITAGVASYATQGGWAGIAKRAGAGIGVAYGTRLISGSANPFVNAKGENDIIGIPFI